MLWAAMVVAFFGLLRAAEYTSISGKKFDRATTLCIEDVNYTQQGATLDTKASKTDIFRTGVSIRLAANQSTLCPFRALMEYLKVQPRQEGPLFMFASGRYLTRSDVSVCMKTSSNVGANMSSHSFRIGGATTLANMGYPRWLIQGLGRWSSDCFREYIRIADSTIGGFTSHGTTASEHAGLRSGYILSLVGGGGPQVGEAAPGVTELWALLWGRSPLQR